MFFNMDIDKEFVILWVGIGILSIIRFYMIIQGVKVCTLGYF